MSKMKKSLLLLLIISVLIVLLWHYFPMESSSDDKFNILYYLLLITMISGGMVARFRGNISGGLKQGLIWVAAFMALLLLYSFRNDFVMLKERIIAELMPSRAQATRQGTLEFRISSDGHFRINTLVNGVSVRFMLDTGASDIVIPPHIARKIGLDIAKLSFNKIYNTANGQGRGAPFIIRSLQIGDFRFNNLQASVNEAEMDSPLLGMSFLEKLAGYEVADGVLKLKP